MCSSDLKENYPETHIIPGDIKKLNGKDFLDASGLQVGEVRSEERRVGKECRSRWSP